MEPNFENPIGLVRIIGGIICGLTIIIAWRYIYIKWDRGIMKGKFFSISLRLATLLPAAAPMGKEKGET